MSKNITVPAYFERDPVNLEFLSQQARFGLRGFGEKEKARIKPKAKIRRLAEPRIHEHKRKNRQPFYTYQRGADQEIYLGDADTILRKVKG